MRSISGIYHVMLRGINKQILFECDNDRYRFIKTLDRYRVICKYELYGYCLMVNHVHLLLKENDESISTSIKRICSSYVYWYNWKYDRCGHLFQERYNSETVESEVSLLRVLRYIHQNPVKAGVSEITERYAWSSNFKEYYRKNIVGQGTCPLVPLIKLYFALRNALSCLLASLTTVSIPPDLSFWTNSGSFVSGSEAPVRSPVLY